MTFYLRILKRFLPFFPLFYVKKMKIPSFWHCLCFNNYIEGLAIFNDVLDVFSLWTISLLRELKQLNDASKSHQIYFYT